MPDRQCYQTVQAIYPQMDLVSPQKTPKRPPPSPFKLATFDDPKKVITESVSNFIAYDLFINLMI